MSRTMRELYLKNPATKELLSILKSLGYKLKIVNNPQKLDGAYGRFNQALRRISVTIKWESGGNVSLSFFLHNLAHEIRHAIHATEGLYRNYYESLLKGSVPNIGVGTRAENDCHIWANKYLEKLGMSVKLPKGYVLLDSYPTEEVLGYAQYCQRFGKKN